MYKKTLFIKLIISCIFLTRGVAHSMCEVASVEARQSNQVVSLGLITIPKSLDPAKAWNFQHFFLIRGIYSNVVRISNNGSLASDLSSRWEISPDGIVYKFYLRDDAVFHNSAPVTSNDVATSLARHFWPSSKSAVRGYIRGIIQGTDRLSEGALPNGIKVISPKEFEIYLVKPYPSFLYILTMSAFSIAPANDPYREKMIGSGPLKVSHFDGQCWVLDAFDRYYSKRIGHKRLLISQIDNAGDPTGLLSKGDIDAALGLSLTALSVAKLPDKYETTATMGLVYNHLFLNSNNPIFKNSDFRSDLGKLVQNIARQSIEGQKYYEFQPYYIPKGIMPNSYYSRSDTAPSESAFIQNWRKYVQGKTLKVVLREDNFPKSTAAGLEKLLTNLGIRPNIIWVGIQDYLNYLKRDDYDIISGAYTGNFPDPDGFLDPLNMNSSIHYGVMRTDDLFRQIDKIRFMTPHDARLESYSKYLKEFESRYYFIPLFRMYLPVVHNVKLTIPQTNFKYEVELSEFSWVQ